MLTYSKKMKSEIRIMKHMRNFNTKKATPQNQQMGEFIHMHTTRDSKAIGKKLQSKNKFICISVYRHTPYICLYVVYI